MLGSDYPFPLGEGSPGKMIESNANINETVKKDLFYTNALNWLGLNKV